MPIRGKKYKGIALALIIEQLNRKREERSSGTVITGIRCQSYALPVIFSIACAIIGVGAMPLCSI